MTNNEQSGQNTQMYDELFAKLGLSNLSEEEKLKRVEEMQEVVEGRVFLRLMSMLNDDDKKKFEEMAEDADFEAFFKERGIDVEKISFEEGVAYREELIYSMGFIAGKMEK